MRAGYVRVAGILARAGVRMTVRGIFCPAFAVRGVGSGCRPMLGHGLDGHSGGRVALCVGRRIHTWRKGQKRRDEKGACDHCPDPYPGTSQHAAFFCNACHYFRF